MLLGMALYSLDSSKRKYYCVKIGYQCTQQVLITEPLNPGKEVSHSATFESHNNENVSAAILVITPLYIREIN